jgi:hypothetical protein
MEDPMARPLPAALAALALIFTSSCAQNPATRTPPPQQPGASAKAGPFKPRAEVLKDTREIAGFFTTHLKRDHTLFLELKPDQLDRDFGMVLHFSRGVGDFNVHQGLPLTDMRLMRFRRLGDQIHLLHMNPYFTAAAGSPLRTALDGNIGHSIADVFKIEAEEGDAVIVNVTGFFASDYGNVSQQLRWYYNQRPVTFEREKSFVEGVMGFPRNVEIDANVNYKSADYPGFGGMGVSDYRSIPVGVRYSLVALPDEPMQPRLGDDRVGHFLTAIWDFSRDQHTTPYQRYVQRWRLEKRDPSAARSEPVQPIVFYIDRSVPHEYRRWVREGIEGWNKAFDAAGFIDAIVARDAPDDPEWSAEDLRYSTVRWTPGYQMGYAIGPSQTDPRTGEILNADVLISSSWVTSWLNTWQRWAGVDAMIAEHQQLQRVALGMGPERAHHVCTAAAGAGHELGLQYLNLLAVGALEAGSPMPEEYLGPAIRDLVLHEVGHTLGLRHNFKASSGIPYDRLHDREFTRRHGTSLSVMDYAAVNLAVDPREQGHYWNMEVGSYDVWAIKYAYAPVYEQTEDAPFSYSGVPATTPEAELVGLRKLASQAGDPLHTYATDEDNWLGPYAVDPYTNARDLGSDPLRFARDRHAIIDRIQPMLERRLVRIGDPYAALRSATTGIIFERYAALSTAIKQVGGIHHVRDRRGDPGNRPPFTPVTAERQREAVRMVIDNAFAEGAFRFEPELLNKLAPNRFSHWNTWGGVPVDYPVHQQIGSVQDALLEQLFDPVRLQRMVDNQVRMPAGQRPYAPAELFETVGAAIWAELGLAPRAPRNIDSFRRNLQRAHVNRLTGLMLDQRSPWQTLPTPEDARSLARYELSELSRRIDRALAARGSLDTPTRAHLAETKARVDRALDASLTL